MYSLLKSDYEAATGSKSNHRLFLKLLSDPNFQTIFYYRLSIWAVNKGFLGKILAKLCWIRNIKKSSCHLSFKSRIGAGLVFPHATGIVIGDGVYIENDVTIYQNVTLGKKSIKGLGYPKIRSNVIIYSGACIIGPIQIESNSIIAANAVVLNDVPKCSIVVGIPGKRIN